MNNTGLNVEASGLPGLLGVITVYERINKQKLIFITYFKVAQMTSYKQFTGILTTQFLQNDYISFDTSLIVFVGAFNPWV